MLCGHLNHFWPVTTAICSFSLLGLVIGVTAAQAAPHKNLW